MAGEAGHRHAGIGGVSAGALPEPVETLDNQQWTIAAWTIKVPNTLGCQRAIEMLKGRHRPPIPGVT